MEVTEISNHWEGVASIVSWILGWGYFLAWSGSFYPQPIINWKRGSTEGLTADFPTLNVVGFVCYTASSAAFLFSPRIRQQYASRHPLDPEPTVRFNDFVFALHALVACIITYSQLWGGLWRFEDTRARHPSSGALGVTCGAILSIAAIAFIVGFEGPKPHDAATWSAIDVIYALSYIKLLVTVIKYVPQAWHNYKVKSTEGWSIVTIMFDMSGGVLSLLQLVIDSALQSDWSGISGNPVKFGLSIISLFFDFIFVVQHYFVYGKGSHDKAESPHERQALLS